MRTVICHYHIYKNSGTTFDVLLSKNYGDAHVLFDGPFPYFQINQFELERIIMRNPRAVAFSSHQISLPVPASLNFRVLPVVFIRHPILRIQSIYEFKRKEADGTLTSQMAQKYDFADWIEYCQNSPTEITQISNSQTRLVGGVYMNQCLRKRGNGKMVYDIDQALRNIQTVELLARTEHFNADVQKFPTILHDNGIEFEFYSIEPKNVTSANLNKSIADRLAEIENRIGAPRYEFLVNANEQDIILYNEVTRILDMRHNDAVVDKVNFSKALGEG